MEIRFGSHRHLVVNNVLGLNSDSQQRIMRDKHITYRLLHEVVAMPKTEAFIDPDPKGPFARFSLHETVDEIIREAEKQFTYPIIVKRNSGTMMRNVFLVRNTKQCVKALTRIYSKKQTEYDHVALVQPYIDAVGEYRVVAVCGRVRLVYGKRRSATRADLNKSQVDGWNNQFGRKVVTNQMELDRFQSLTDQIYTRFKAAYMGIDVVEDRVGQLWVIELNGDPLYSGFIADNDPAVLHPLFEEIVKKLALYYD